MNQIWNTSHKCINEHILRYTACDDSKLDERIFLPYDLKATEVHAEMLHKIGIISKKELKLVTDILDELLEQFNEGTFYIPEGMEDCHTAIEAYLTIRHGKLGKKIHTARSRNDQALTMIRLYMKDQLHAISESMEKLSKQWKSWSEKYYETPMPGYTHMQKAMPSNVGTWQSAYADALDDLLILLKSVNKICDQSPLGSGAGYGIPLDIDRKFTSNKLGFNRIQDNPIYCQLSRGPFESMQLFSFSQIMNVLSKWSNDLLLFTMSEFSYFELPAEYCTSSSIMPQKKNYDVLEIIRGSSSIVESACNEIQLIQRSLYVGYQRDLQLLKAPLTRGSKTTLDSLEISLLISKALEVNKNKLQNAMTAELFATEEVYNLVKKGKNFRDAYSEIKNKMNI